MKYAEWRAWIMCIDQRLHTERQEAFIMQEIAVDENYRRQGVAKELLDFMIADTRKRKLKKIELDVWEFNDSAIEFYQATGFKKHRDGWNMKWNKWRNPQKNVTRNICKALCVKDAPA